MPEEDISFRTLLHELWKSWEEKTGVVLMGLAPWWSLPWCHGALLARDPFAWVGGKVCPSPPTAAAGRGCWRSPWCKSIPIWGRLLSSRAGWCMHREWGSFCTGSDVARMPQLLAWRPLGGVRRLPWVLGGEAQGNGSLAGWLHAPLLASPISCVSLCPAGGLRCRCSAVRPLQHPTAPSTGPSPPAAMCCSVSPVLHPGHCRRSAPAWLVGKDEGINSLHHQWLSC